MTATLLLFLSLFGSIVPDTQPAFANYYQNIAQGNNGFDNLTRLNGVESDLSEFTFVWILQGNEYETFDIAFNQIEWSCDGVMIVTLRAIHSSGAEFERSQVSFAEWANTSQYPSPCVKGYSVADLSPIWEDYCCYEYQTKFSPFDYNQDNQFSTFDLLGLLTDFMTNFNNF